MTGSYAAEWPGLGGFAKVAELVAQETCRRGAGWRFTRPGAQGPTPEELAEMIATYRRRGRQGGPWGGGPWAGGPWGGGPWGRRGRGRGRARRGDVRLAVLRLLAEEPRNGYQLMQTIDQRSEGRWSPSPGSVYPTLAQLEDEGLIASDEQGGSRLWQLSDAGREHLQTRASEPDPWAAGEDDADDAIGELGAAFFGVAKAVWQGVAHGDAAQRARAVSLLEETRRGLYRILAEEPEQADHEATEDEPSDG
ncbi:MAG: PadR family transcriptional regulator [Solirubrobacteraceae bacterium]